MNVYLLIFQHSRTCTIIGKGAREVERKIHFLCSEVWNITSFFRSH